MALNSWITYDECILCYVYGRRTDGINEWFSKKENKREKTEKENRKTRKILWYNYRHVFFPSFFCSVTVFWILFYFFFVSFHKEFELSWLCNVRGEEEARIAWTVVGSEKERVVGHARFTVSVVSVGWNMMCAILNWTDVNRSKNKSEFDTM